MLLSLLICICDTPLSMSLAVSVRDTVVLLVAVDPSLIDSEPAGGVVSETCPCEFVLKATTIIKITKRAANIFFNIAILILEKDIWNDIIFFRDAKYLQLTQVMPANAPIIAEYSA